MNEHDMRRKIDRTLEELEKKSRKRRRKLATAGATAGLLMSLGCGLDPVALYAVAEYGVLVPDAAYEDAAGADVEPAVRYGIPCDAGMLDPGPQVRYGVSCDGC